MSFHFWNAQPTVLSMARPPWLWFVAPRASLNALGADVAVADRWGIDTKAVPAITAAAAAVFDIAMVKFLYTATNKNLAPQFLAKMAVTKGKFHGPVGEEMTNSPWGNSMFWGELPNREPPKSLLRIQPKNRSRSIDWMSKQTISKSSNDVSKKAQNKKNNNIKWQGKHLQSTPSNHNTRHLTWREVDTSPLFRSIWTFHVPNRWELANKTCLFHHTKK